MDYQKALSAIDQNQDYLLDTLRRLVSVNTAVPPGANYDKLCDVMEPIYRSFGFKTERVIVPPEKLAPIPLPLKGDRVNLVATREYGKPVATIYGHMDVVPAEGNWTHNPFDAEVVGDMVYGRGVSDMKGQIACLLTVIKVINDLKLSPQFDLNCIMCTDEEIGYYPGAYHLALEGYVKGHLVWLEPGVQEPVIPGSAAGYLDAIISVIGKSTHSGRNWDGVNALEESVPILVELLALKERIQSRKSKDQVRNSPQGLVPITGLFNIDIIQSGVKANIVPDLCKITCNRRYLAGEKFEDVKEEIDTAINRGKEKSKALDVKVDWFHAYPPTLIDMKTKYMERAKKVRKMVHGYKDFIVTGGTGSVDLGFALSAVGHNNAVSFGTGMSIGGTAHAVDEHIPVKNLTGMAKELLLYLILDEPV
jgi:succinyl-diaminopimelate desuccinylase